MSDYQHRPVLLEEAVQALNIRPDGKYLDGTFGRGGHSEAILACLSKQGCLLALDRDPEAVNSGKEKLGEDPRFSIVHGEFAEMERYVREWGVEEGLDGILLDIGVSSPQLDDPVRGFSFMGDGPLDMRMNPLQGVSAEEWLAEAPERELTRVFREFGEERHARRIARSIVLARQKQRLETTGQLARLIEDTKGRREKNKHPATRCFQAIRIWINEELADLAQGLEAAIEQLRPGGTVSGPVMMEVADCALYVAILAEIGLVSLAVTTSLNINFLRKPSAQADILAELGKHKGSRVLVGFAGSAADAFTLSEKFEAKLEEFRGNFERAAVELAKDWRTDKYLRRLEALLAVVGEAGETWAPEREPKSDEPLSAAAAASDAGRAPPDPRSRPPASSSR